MSRWHDPKDKILASFKLENIEPVGCWYPSKTQLRDTAIEACKMLADTPCPVCMSGQQALYSCPPGEILHDGDYIPCPNCGGFPDHRKGKAFRDWQGAADRVKEHYDFENEELEQNDSSPGD